MAPLQRDGDELCDARARLARAVEQDALLRQAPACRALRGQQPCAQAKWGRWGSSEIALPDDTNDASKAIFVGPGGRMGRDALVHGPCRPRSCSAAPGTAQRRVSQARAQPKRERIWSHAHLSRCFLAEGLPRAQLSRQNCDIHRIVVPRMLLPQRELQTRVRVPPSGTGEHL